MPKAPAQTRRQRQRSADHATPRGATVNETVQPARAALDAVQAVIDERLQLVSAEDLTELFNVSRSTIYEWRDQGQMPQPVALPGRVTRWRVSDLITWMAGGCRPCR